MSRAETEIWVPVQINLPLGAFKAVNFSPNSCGDLQSLIFGPFTIIFLAQCSLTILVPVLPFLVKDIGVRCAHQPAGICVAHHPLLTCFLRARRATWLPMGRSSPCCGRRRLSCRP